MHNLDLTKTISTFPRNRSKHHDKHIQHDIKSRKLLNGRSTLRTRHAKFYLGTVFPDFWRDAKDHEPLWFGDV